MKKILCIVAVCVFFLAFAFLFKSSQSTIQLNEIVSCNERIICDNTGSFHDYIELYNPTSDDVDISGYFLSDSKKNLKKFTFPKDSVIKAKSFFLVWAGTEKRTIFTDNNYPFTHFSIKNGEKIYLSNRNGKIIDKAKVPKDLDCDMSYSRVPFTSKWGKRKPTPEKQNPLYEEKKQKNLSDVSVEFNLPSGFYDEPIELKMTAPEGFDIYYTLDSTSPTERSFKYTAPIKITDATSNPNKYSAIESIVCMFETYTTPDFDVDKGTIVRAVAIRKSDGAVSNIKSASYFVNLLGRKFYKRMPLISIISEPKDLFNYETGIYVSGKIWDMHNNIDPDAFDFFALPETYSNFSARGKHFTRKTQIDYIKDNHTSSMTGKIKIQGNWTRRFAQKNFAFSDMKNEETKTSVPDFNLRAIHSGERLIETAVYSLVENRLSIPIKFDFVNVFLDGEYWGLYALYDKITPDFILKNTSLTKPDLVDLQYSEKSFGYSQIPDFKNKTFDEIKELFDLNSLINYVAINIYTSNRDTCDLLDGNNVVRWKSREKPELNKWHWILFDQDNHWLNETDDYFNNENCSLIKNELLKKLFEEPAFKKQFIITFQDIGDYTFNPTKVRDTLSKIRNQYSRSIIQTSRRFYGANQSRMLYILWLLRAGRFFDFRFNHAMAQMKQYFSLKGDLVEVHKIPSKTDGGVVLFNTLKIPATEQYDARYFSDYAISLDAQTFDGYRFAGWMIDNKLITTQKLDLSLEQPRTIEAIWEKEQK